MKIKTFDVNIMNLPGNDFCMGRKDFLKFWLDLKKNRIKKLDVAPKNAERKNKDVDHL